MRKIESLRDVQIIELNILKYIRTVCERNELRYFLAGGTLLGAVRHKGFIPWDNDLDISMPRPDYEALLKVFDAEAKRDNVPYELLAISNTKRYCCPFIKVVDDRTILKDGVHQKYKGGSMGVFVDIFPIDGIASNQKKNVRQVLHIRNKCINLGLSFAKFDNLNFKEKLMLLMYKFIYGLRNREKLLRNMQKSLEKNDFYTSQYIMSTFGMRGEKEVILQQYFADEIKIQFEDDLFSAPIGYAEYLTQMYGDYMQMPPVEKRVAPHDYEEYWK